MSLDIICDKEPPSILTDTEYTIAKYDGTATMSNVSFPSLTRTVKLKVTSTVQKSELPRNYNTNLTYTCGDAKLFKVVLK